MSEFNELKKKIGEVFQILFKMLISAIEELAASIREKRWPASSRKTLLVLGVGGFFIIASIGKAFSSSGGNASFLSWFFQEEIYVPGEQSDGSFLLGDFETQEELNAWLGASADLEISDRNAVQGEHSLEVIFLGGVPTSSLMLEDYFKSRKAKTNWSAYQAFEIHISNPRQAQERLILQIKDKKGLRFKQNLKAPAGGLKVFTVPIRQLAQKLDIQNIAQISLFRWKPKTDRNFYIDAVRLVPVREDQRSQAALQVKPIKERPVNPLDFGFKARRPAWEIKTSMAGDSVIRVPFILRNETKGPCNACPVEGGIPFPQGELKDLHHLVIRNAALQEVPFQARVLGRWPDKSLKWIGFHFDTTLAPGQVAGHYVEYGEQVKKPVFGSRFRVIENDSMIRVQNGKMEVRIDKTQFYLFESVFLDLNKNSVMEPTERVVSQAPLTLTFRGKEFRADFDKKTYEVEIEEKGTQRAVVKASSWFQSREGQRYGKLVLRYTFYAEKNYVKVAHTFIYTGYPENRFYHKYRGLKLPKNETVDSFGLTLPYEFFSQDGAVITAGKEKGQTFEDQQSQEVRFMQLAWDESSLQRDGVRSGASTKLRGWVDLSSNSRGVAVAVRNFKENFPKAFYIDRKSKQLHIALWPKEAGALDLATTSNALGEGSAARGSAFGLAKTHDLLFYFHEGDAATAKSAEVAETFMTPMIIRTNPFWVDATGALGRLYPVTQRFATEEKMLEALFDWAARQPKDFRWYGMLNFGDVQSWYRKGPDGSFGWFPTGRWGWYNCEMVGIHTGALLQFARTGEFKYFQFGENFARHLMDVDTVHHNTIQEDSRLRKILDDEVSQVGSIHRHNGDHWGGRNEESSHTSVVGILYYYYLSGNERALDVAKEIGEFYLKEPFTYTGHPDQAPHRAMANALWGDVLLYEATGDPRYKAAADKIIEIYLKGQEEDGSFLETYNPLDGSWSGKKHGLYMTSYALGAFISYHQLTQDKEVKEMLLRLVKFLKADPAALHGASYAYFLTGEREYIQTIDTGLSKLLKNQKVSSNPMIDGLIYDKVIYHRPTSFLYSTVYAMEALEASQGDR